MSARVLIYGANGYTGALIARRMLRHGLNPILAGRNVSGIRSLGKELELETRILRLEDRAALEDALAGVAVVLNCAGPFRETFRTIAKACLVTRTHYMDITGELNVYRRLMAIDMHAREAQVMLLPGIGFDVAPSDCLALYLKGVMPEAERLELAFRSYGPAKISRGTMKTGLITVNDPIRFRHQGKINSVPPFKESQRVNFGQGDEAVDLMTWGDVVTAYYSTRIPNIKVYFKLSDFQRKQLKRLRRLGPLLDLEPLRRLAHAWIDRQPPGPTEAEIIKSRTVIWGKVEEATEHRAVARLYGPEAYEFTAQAAIAGIRRVLDGQVKPGYQTPGTAFGSDFILDVPGTRFEDIV